MLNFTKKIEEAIEKCRINGNGRVECKDKDDTFIHTDWEELEGNPRYDAISVYIYQEGIIKFYYQEESTKVEAG